jgi:sortase A
MTMNCRTLISTVFGALVVLAVSGVGWADDSSIADAEDWYLLPAPDQSDWSNKRRSGFAKMSAKTLGVPEAVLKVPDLGLSVAVYDNVERPALEVGAGWVEGTAKPGESGNVAIAGHRDGFFRSLERIKTGQEIILVTADQSLRYLVDDVSIVDPLDVSVLEPSSQSVLTLITCYPFRYVGFAPDRYIVRARLLDE